MVVLKLDKITRTFQQGQETLHILKGVDLLINPGEVVGLVGASGSGKTTLLQIAGLLEKPSSGEVWIQSQNCSGLSEQERTRMRGKTLGFVYQFHHLLPEFTALENVMMPGFIAGISKTQAMQDATTLLERLSLGHRLHHKPKELSGGEQQRVAMARALMNSPSLILADEPTGNLDRDTANAVFNELLSLVKETKLSALIATHDLALAEKMTRIVSIENGLLKGV
jgi:lipoprotein-releasing system ATP-binding protein